MYTPKSGGNRFEVAMDKIFVDSLAS